VTTAYGDIRTYVLISFAGKGGAMRLLRLAVEIQRWDLAAHTIVLASARVIKNGERPDGGKTKTKKKRIKG
jgi:hypothetical protein